MKLKEYLKENNLTLKDFAQSIFYSKVHLCNISNEKCVASPKLARAIFVNTNGLVDLRGE